MGRNILIKAGAVEAEAELNDTTTVRTIEEALFLEGHINLWVDEIHLSIPPLALS